MYNCCKCFPGLSFLPVLLVSGYSTTFFITYTIAVLQKHTYAIFTYISDAGALMPENGVFSQMLNLGAFVALAFFYVRHRQVREICEMHNSRRKLRMLSKVCWYLGIIVSISSTVVGNFPVHQAMAMHAVGAITGFVSISSWMLLQAYMSFKLYPLIGNSYINCIRVIFLTISLITFSTCIITAVIAFQRYKGHNILKWDPEDSDYELHAVSVIMEWTFVHSTLAYFLTFAYELKDVSFEEPVIKINNVNFVT
ncbi:hypothetical protein ILUMI_08976 [Ignelater luminosus]|uniref:CWH43-like N-terminal domain-containing protein n=1 Tax=Ignelater luminosus TaxID=2038154 RepID=A0A8K0D6P0_IGNLU|nr:hypothetical protein ILUMI_08976 [Ignelater luminosus]